MVKILDGNTLQLLLTKKAGNKYEHAAPRTTDSVWEVHFYIIMIL